MSAVDSLDRSRRRVLLGSLVGFTVWQGATIANGWLGPASVSRSFRIALVVIALAGSAYWTFYLFQMIRWTRRVSVDAALASALTDERWQMMRLKAFSLAFYAVMAIQGIIVITTVLFFTIPTMIAAQLTILVGCVAAIGGFLWFERE